MTTEAQISKVREERDEAGQELRHTLIEVSAKVEELEERLRPDRMIESFSNRGRSSCRCCGVFSWLKSPSYGRRASHFCRSARLCDLEKVLGS